MQQLSTAKLLKRHDKTPAPVRDLVLKNSKMLITMDNTEAYFARKMAHAQSVMVGLKLNFSLPIVKA